MSDLASVESLEATLAGLVGCLTAPGLVGAPLSARVDQVLKMKGVLPGGSGDVGWLYRRTGTVCMHLLSHKRVLQSTRVS